jgi:hypothetical protein
MPPSPEQELRERFSWVRRHKILSGIGAAAVLFGIVGAFTDGGGSNTAGSPAAASPPAATPVAQAPVTSAPQPAKVTKTPSPPARPAKPAKPAAAASSERIIFSVTGRAPQGVDVSPGLFGGWTSY